VKRGGCRAAGSLLGAAHRPGDGEALAGGHWKWQTREREEAREMTLRRPGQRAGTPHAQRPPRPEPPQPFERYWSRTGTEPVTARSAMGVRLILAALFTPVFLAATALFWYWTTQTGPGDVPGVDSLRTLTAISAGLALFAVTDLIVVLRRRRRRRGPPPPSP
jgi:hypothetical protein